MTSLATAAGIIGFLHLDGGGTQTCNVTAVKWFKVAAENGTRALSWAGCTTPDSFDGDVG